MVVDPASQEIRGPVGPTAILEQGFVIVYFVQAAPPEAGTGQELVHYA
jgi:hypothetical protein